MATFALIHGGGGSAWDWHWSHARSSSSAIRSAAFSAPLVCARIPVDLLVLVAATTPSSGEFLNDWWANSRYEASGYGDVFYHDLHPDLAAEAQRRERDETSRALRELRPLAAWPGTPTRYLLCRDGRMLPAAWARRHARERLGSSRTRWTAATTSR